MRILLIWVPFKLEEIYGRLENSAPILPPLELAYIASYLKSKGHTVSLVDAHALGLDLHHIEGIVKEFNPDLVGTTSNSPIFSFIYSVYSRALEMMRIVKQVAPQAKTFLSGYHPTMSPKEALNEDCIDYAIIGDGEIPVANLCEALKNGVELKNVEGIGFKEGDEIVINKRGPHVKDLDIFPMPAYDLLPMEKYRFASNSPRPMKGVSLRASRGCSFDCFFCPSPGFAGRALSTHSPEYVVNTMNHLHDRYGFDQFQMHDDNFGVNKQWLLRFCALLKENKIKFSWDCYERFDLLREDVLIAMKEAGCRMISLGVESGTEEILLKVKGLTKKKVEDGMKLLRDLGFKVRLFFMIGQPSKTTEDVKRTIQYAIKLNPDVFLATISIPYPGSDFHKDSEEAQYIPDFRNRLIPSYEATCDDPYFSKGQLNQMLKYAYRSFYLRPGYIFRQWKNLLNVDHLSHNLKGLIFLK